MTATQLLKRVDIFISSPSDVGPERHAVRWAIEFLNRAWYIANGYLLFPLAYEDVVPPEMGQAAQVIVDRYMHEPDRCYMLICVLWKRMGTPFTDPVTHRVYQSGTEYEFTRAYEANRRAGKPVLLLYRREPGEAATDDVGQREQVAAFFERFGADVSGFVGLHRRYTSLDEFRELVLQNIADVIRQYPPAEAQAVIERPEMIEEPRRLDAAIPQAARESEPTELWVQVCLPSSLGFRGELPEARVSAFELSQEDVRGPSLGVAFPLDLETRLPKSVVLSVEVVAPDFDMPTSVMALEVSPGKDSARLLFSMVPKTGRTRSIVHVHVRQRMPEGVDVLIASAALYTRLVTAATANPGWSFTRCPLDTFETGHSYVTPTAHWQDGSVAMLVARANHLCVDGFGAKAMALQKKAAKMCHASGDLYGLLASLRGLALVSRNGGDLHSALALLSEQERICRKLGKIDALAEALVHQAELLARLGRVEEGLRVAEEAHRLALEHGLTALVRQIEPTLNDLRQKVRSG